MVYLYGEFQTRVSNYFSVSVSFLIKFQLISQLYLKFKVYNEALNAAVCGCQAELFKKIVWFKVRSG